MPYRVNGQYIMEGLASSFLFNIGGLGFVILDLTNNKSTPKLNRTLLTGVGFACIIVSYFTCWTFMRMKLPYVFIYFFTKYILNLLNVFYKIFMVNIDN